MDGGDVPISGLESQDRPSLRVQAHGESVEIEYPGSFLAGGPVRMTMGKKDEFDSSGETAGYISLDQALLEARRLARQSDERYTRQLGWEQIVWAESSSEQREDSYRVVLLFRRPARGVREEQTGEEEFIFDLTGKLQDRQVLVWPEGTASGARSSSAAPSLEDEAPRAPHFPPQRPGSNDGMFFPPFVMMRMCLGVLAAFFRGLKRLVELFQPKERQNKG